MAELAAEIGVDFLFAVRFFPDQKKPRVKMFTEKEASEASEIIARIELNQEKGQYGGTGIIIPTRTIDELTGRIIYPLYERKTPKCFARMFKLGINPHGIVYCCEYAEHPHNAKKELAIGDLSSEEPSKIIAKSISLNYDKRH